LPSPAGWLFISPAYNGTVAKELHEAHVTREEAAEQLETLAEELRDDDGLDVTVGNRTVHLSPPSNVNLELGVREKSSRFRGDRESVTVAVEWKPE
jgi:amphi-Trp domain-containing protein